MKLNKKEIFNFKEIERVISGKESMIKIIIKSLDGMEFCNFLLLFPLILLHLFHMTSFDLILFFIFLHPLAFYRKTTFTINKRAILRLFL